MPHKALKELKSANFTSQIHSSCGTIPTEDIKRYYDIAMAMEWEDGWYPFDKIKKKRKHLGINIYLLVVAILKNLFMR